MINPITIGFVIVLLIIAFGIYDEWYRLRALDWILIVANTITISYLGFLFYVRPIL